MRIIYEDDKKVDIIEPILCTNVCHKYSHFMFLTRPHILSFSVAILFWMLNCVDFPGLFSDPGSDMDGK